MSPLNLFLASTLLKVTAVLAFAGAAALIARRASAATRHLIWTSALAGAVLIPAMALFVPAWKLVPVKSAEVKQEAVTAIAPATESQVATTEAKPVKQVKRQSDVASSMTPVAAAPTPVASSPEQPQPMSHRFGFELIPTLLLTWCAGSVLVFGRYLVNSLRLKKLVSAYTRSGDVAEERRLRELAERLKIARPVSLVESAEIEVPMTWGVIYPRVLLPNAAKEWTHERLDAVLQHELAHVKRFDALTQWLSHVACAIYWFHPLAWYAAKQMRAERERACDDFVLHAGVQPSRYAKDLLEIVSSFKSATEQYPAALAMARKSQFEGRLMALLNPKAKRSAISQAQIVLTMVLMLVVALPLAAITTKEVSQAGVTGGGVSGGVASGVGGGVGSGVGSGVSGGVASGVSGGLRSGVSGGVATEYTTIAASEPMPMLFAAVQSGYKSEADLLQGCSRTTNSHQSISNSDGNDTKLTVSWSSDDCDITLKAQGKFTYKPDFTGFQTISPGGSINVTADVKDQVTKLTVKNGDNGLEYRYYRNGNEEPFGPSAEKWLGQLLTTLDRLSAVGIDVRFPKLIREGGPTAVLNEVQLMPATYARSRYLMKLVSEVPLKSTELKQVFTVVGNFDSDYERARVLMAGAQKYDLADAGVRDAFLSVTQKMSSDYEHGRTLMAFLDKGPATAPQVQAILQSLQKFSSDYERGRVLILMAQKHKLDQNDRGLYLAATDRFSSDYERGRTLAALIDSQASDDQTALGIIRSAQKMTSDYERSRVLMALAGSRKIESQLRDAYEEAAQQMSSDYERGRALKALGLSKQARSL